MMNKNQLLLYHPHQGDLTGAIVVGSGLQYCSHHHGRTGRLYPGEPHFTNHLAANQEILSAEKIEHFPLFFLPPFSIEVIIFVFYFFDGNASPVSAMHWLLHSVK